MQWGRNLGYKHGRVENPWHSCYAMKCKDLRENNK